MPGRPGRRLDRHERRLPGRLVPAALVATDSDRLGRRPAAQPLSATYDRHPRPLWRTRRSSSACLRCCPTPSPAAAPRRARRALRRWSPTRWRRAGRRPCSTWRRPCRRRDAARGRLYHRRRAPEPARRRRRRSGLSRSDRDCARRADARDLRPVRPGAPSQRGGRCSGDLGGRRAWGASSSPWGRLPIICEPPVARYLMSDRREPWVRVQAMSCPVESCRDLPGTSGLACRPGGRRRARRWRARRLAAVSRVTSPSVWTSWPLQWGHSVMLRLLSATTRDTSKWCPHDMQAKRRVGLKWTSWDTTAVRADGGRGVRGRR